VRWIFVFYLVVAWSCAVAQTLPTGFSRVQVGGTINNPTVMAFAPDGRIFVAEQGGILRVIKNGTQLATPFITLTVNSLGERGLLGIAFDPEFTTNNYIYLYYTTTGLHNRISRFTANGDVVLAGSEHIILELDLLSGATNHNGGALAFGRDGKLYVAIGENANGAYAQNLDIYHGKLLRINKDGSAPSDNPFFLTGTERGKRIWAYGLRNPYTFSIHPGTGRVLVNDVGQSTFEEVNDATTGGKNFGWPTTEGNTTNPNFTSPIFSYAHSGNQPTGCAITGGTFFNNPGTNYPPIYYGKYFFLDLCSAWIYYFDPSVAGSSSTQFALNIGGQSLALTAGPDGNLYYLSRTSARLYKIVYTPPATAPVITGHPQPATVTIGQPVSFTVTATGAAPLGYQWYRDGTTLEGETQATMDIASVVATDAGNYYATVSNADGEVLSNKALLTITAPVDEQPVALVVKPAEGETYRAGAAIAFEGTGTDPQDGALDASAFSWAINFHHDTHNHDQPAITGVKSGSFDVPDRGETSSNVWYRFILTVTDAQGITSKDSVDVHPLTSKLTVATNPPGLGILIDGQPATAPITITSVEGLKRDISVEEHQEVGGSDFHFSLWQTGESATLITAAAQTITTPPEDETYTAVFLIIPGFGDGDNDLSAYPNPASGWIHFSDPNINTVSIMNSVGKSTTLTTVSTAEKASVDVHQFSPGMYVLFYSGRMKRIIIK
jgi:glucose/arabinose dehydrogenase